jgi:tRNA(adenine34) deaminase
MFSDQDRSFMKMALEEAQLSFNDNEVPVGAIIVKDNEVIGSGHNQVIHTNNVTSHAEINAIIDASKNTNNYRLNNAKMYVTLEPCHMCAKAIVDARINEVIFAALEPKTGSLISIDNLLERVKFNHQVHYRYGLLKYESSNLLKDFFKNKR